MLRVAQWRVLINQQVDGVVAIIIIIIIISSSSSPGRSVTVVAMPEVYMLWPSHMCDKIK